MIKTPKKPKTRPIPKNLMQDGINLCKQNVTQFLDDSRLVIAQGRLNHAYILVQLGIEELGKIVILNEATDSATTDSIEVDASVFTSHNKKSEKAWNVLDTKYRLIFDEGNWKEGFRKSGTSTHITFASHETRLQCAFVNFDGQQWTQGCNIKENSLQNLISHIEEKIKVI
jgi:AbiV family abortive infection protein